MKTIFSVVLLIIFGVVCNFLIVYILNIAGVPGALIAGTPEKRNKNQFILGSIISAVGQSYIYLIYVAFIVSWTKLAANRPDVISFILWPTAFLSILIPIWINLMRARVENKEQEHASPQVEALHLTVLIAIIGFFVFVFSDGIMRFAWGWVPYVE